MNAQKKAKVRIPSARTEDQPATRKMLHLVRDELVQRMDAGFAQIDSRFKEQDSKFASIDSRFASIDSKLSRIEEAVLRMELKYEEQKDNNRIVLEGHQLLWQRMDRMEEKLDHAIARR